MVRFRALCKGRIVRGYQSKTVPLVDVQRRFNNCRGRIHRFGNKFAGFVRFGIYSSNNPTIRPLRNNDNIIFRFHTRCILLFAGHIIGAIQRVRFIIVRAVVAEQRHLRLFALEQIRVNLFFDGFHDGFQFFFESE